jgi:hypothetical protein
VTARKAGLRPGLRPIEPGPESLKEQLEPVVEHEHAGEGDAEEQGLHASSPDDEHDDGKPHVKPSSVRGRPPTNCSTFIQPF